VITGEVTGDGAGVTEARLSGTAMSTTAVPATGATMPSVSSVHAMIWLDLTVKFWHLSYYGIRLKSLLSEILPITRMPRPRARLRQGIHELGVSLYTACVLFALLIIEIIKRSPSVDRFVDLVVTGV
jgi:hypothetical protein